MPYENFSIIGNVCLKLCWANNIKGIAINPEKETALAIDFTSDKIWVSAERVIWNINKETNEQIITYKIFETKSLKSEL